MPRRLQVGERVQVNYPPAGFYPGTIGEWDAASRRATIVFDEDGSEETIVLGKSGAKAQKGVVTQGKDWKFVNDKLAPQRPSKAPAAKAIAPAPERKLTLLPPSDAPTQLYSLSNNQLNLLRTVYYGRGHLVGHTKLWHLLQRKHPDHGIRNRQMRAWLGAQKTNQLFRLPQTPHKTRPLITPPEPCRVWQVDTIDLNEYKWARGYVRGPAHQGVDDEARVYRYIYVIIDAYTRRLWAHMSPVSATGDGAGAQMSGALKAFRRAFGDARQLFRYRSDLDNDTNVFGRNRRLLRPLVVTADGGGEHGQRYRDAVEELDPNIRVKINAPNQPDLSAYVERVNSSIRQHLRQMIEAELGSIQRKAVQKSLDWPKRLARVETAYNEEYHSNIQQSPNELIEAWFDRTSPEAQVLRDKAVERTSDAELRKRHKQADQLRKLPVGARVRVVRRDLQKKELGGNIRKLQRRWSDTVYTVEQRITPEVQGLGYPSMYKLEGMPKETWYREELQAVPTTHRMPDGKKQTAGRGHVDAGVEAATAEAVSDLTSHVREPLQSRLRDKHVHVLRAYYRQGMTSTDAARRLLRELGVALARNQVQVSDDQLAIMGI